MTTTSDSWLLWTPRVLGVLVSVFIGMFALDAFSTGKPWLTALPDFFVHLIPALVMLAIVIASFRRQWIGAAAFIGLAIFYTVRMSKGRLDWILVISGPMVVVGALYLWSWLRRGRLQAT